MREIQDTTAIVRQTAGEIRQAYGKKPLLLGLLTSDPFKLNLGYTVGGFVLLASGLWTFVLALAYFWANDSQANAEEFKGKTVEVDAMPAERETPPASNPFSTFSPQSESPAAVPNTAMSEPATTDGTKGFHVPQTPSQTAVPVPIAPIVQSQPAPIPVPVSPTAYSVLVGNPFLSRAGFGAQRSGKSYLIAVATQELALEKGVQIFHINLASYGDEDARYWSHAAQSVRCDLPSLDSYQAQHFIDMAIDCVNEFFSTRNAILVFDEITLTGNLSNQHAEAVAPLLKLVADKIACLASTGVKRSQAVWTASPDFVAGACTQDCKSLKSLSLCFVAIAPGKSVDWNGNPIKFHQESFENVKRNFPSLTYPEGRFEGDRICFVDGKWREIGELPALRQVETVQDSAPTKTEQMAQQLEAIYQKPDSLPDHPIADWDNGYVADDESLIEILDAIERKYGKDPFNPSEFYRNTSNKQRNLFGGKIDNFRALLFRAIQEDMAIVEEDDKGTILIRLS